MNVFLKTFLFNPIHLLLLLFSVSDVAAQNSDLIFMSEIAKQKTKNDSPEAGTWFDEIGDNSRSIMESMNDIVWNINPQNNTFESLSVRMRKFASAILDARQINLIFDTEDNLENKKLSMVEHRNLYLIFKEIKKRALEMNAVLEINSVINEGSTFKLHL